jgi:hypothetical protein
MFIVIFLLLGLSFGYAARPPWSLFAFVVPLLLALAASNRSMGAVVLGFAVTAAGLVVGTALAARTGEEQHA